MTQIQNSGKILLRLAGFLRGRGTSVLERQERTKERLTVCMLRQLGNEPPVQTKPNLSDKRLEMELLLLNLGAAGKELLAALATEAELGDQLFRMNSGSTGALARWIEARQAAANAQRGYDRAADDYRSFVTSLAPPLRAAAAARGAGPMALMPGLHNH